MLVGGELAHDGYDARCLFADGTPAHPAVAVRAAGGGRLPAAAGPADLLVEASDGEPSEQHLFRVRTAIGGGAWTRAGSPPTRAGTPPRSAATRWSSASRSLDHAGTRWTVLPRRSARSAALRSLAATPPYAPRPALERVTDRRLPAGGALPAQPRRPAAGCRCCWTSTAARGTRRSWPPGPRGWSGSGGPTPGSRWSPSTTGVRRAWRPSFEKVIHRRLADVILADQVDALTALAGKHPDLDLARVGDPRLVVRRLAGRRWPCCAARTLFRCGDRRRPGHRLGAVRHRVHRALPGPARTTARTSTRTTRCVELAAEPVTGPDEARPMLLVHGMADDNVVAAHTLRLSAALLGAGRPHAVLPLTGATHMAAGGTAERLLRLELDFLRTHLL